MKMLDYFIGYISLIFTMLLIAFTNITVFNMSIPNVFILQFLGITFILSYILLTLFNKCKPLYGVAVTGTIVPIIYNILVIIQGTNFNILIISRSAIMGAIYSVIIFTLIKYITKRK